MTPETTTPTFKSSAIRVSSEQSSFESMQENRTALSYLANLDGRSNNETQISSYDMSEWKESGEGARYHRNVGHQHQVVNTQVAHVIIRI